MIESIIMAIFKGIANWLTFGMINFEDDKNEN